MYRCEKCGGTFERFKVDNQCPLCGVWANVRCEACKYVAPSVEFSSNNDRCPKCGASVGFGGAPDYSIDVARSGMSYTCPKCGYNGELVKEPRGSILLTILLWWCLVVPGILYAATHSGFRGVCYKCGFRVAKQMK